jgi:argininosuccinate lyase
MDIKRSNESIHHRGLRLDKPHAAELNRLFNRHTQADSFREDDLLEINYAHVVMLYEQNLLTREEASRILAAIKKIESEGIKKIIHVDPKIGELSTHVESFIIKQTSIETGGKLHTGRSRNDLFTTMSKMLIRRIVLDVYDALTTLEETFLLLTLQHRETILPAYTHHSKHAQPITLGYFFLGNFDVFSRNLERIENFWPRLDTCPMGAAALATTGFPLNRERMAVLLGFNAIHEHAYDAVSAKDFVLEYLFILATIASDLGRIAENILLWNTLEFGMIVLADEYTSFSSIMPQKKNAVSLETLRALNPIIAGKLHNAFGILKAEPWSNGRETVIMDDDSIDTGKQVRDMILLLNGLLRTVKIDKERMYELALSGFSTATELADTLVREYDFPFRTAHEVVGLVVKRAVDLGLNIREVTAKMIEDNIKEYLRKEVPISSASIEKALDPKENVKIRNIPGGPAFEEVTRMKENREMYLDNRKQFLSQRRSQIGAARKDLDKIVNEILRS